jgi:hypothetical protein
LKTTFIAQSLTAIGLLAMSAVVQAQTTDRVYVIDQRGEVARSGTGLCWRTGFWTPAAAANDPAGCACDKDLLPKGKCEPAAAKPAAAAAPVAKAITIASKELFDYNKAVLTPAGKAAIDREVFGKLKDAGPVQERSGDRPYRPTWDLNNTTRSFPKSAPKWSRVTSYRRAWTPTRSKHWVQARPSRRPECRSAKIRCRRSSWSSAWHRTVVSRSTLPPIQSNCRYFERLTQPRFGGVFYPYDS